MNEKLIESKNNTFYKKLKKIYSSSFFRKNINQTILDGPHLVKSFSQSRFEGELKLRELEQKWLELTSR